MLYRLTYTEFFISQIEPFEKLARARGLDSVILHKFSLSLCNKCGVKIRGSLRISKLLKLSKQDANVTAKARTLIIKALGENINITLTYLFDQLNKG